MPAGKPRLTARARRLIDAIRGQYAGVPVGAEFVAPTSSVGVKSSYYPGTAPCRPLRSTTGVALPGSPGYFLFTTPR